jgi:hypothetical protein
MFRAPLLGIRQSGSLRNVGSVLAIASMTLFLFGLVFIALYAAATSGSHLRYLGVGWLTACAAFASGCLIGLVVGIPRFVSSGGLRHEVQAQVSPKASRTGAPHGTAGVAAAEAGTAVADAQQGAPEPASQRQSTPNSLASNFSPSSNLAEISDWLTKLLLGAGLVELTRLGRPLSGLVDSVARGLQGTSSTTAISGPAVVIAAAILVLYLVLGFLDGYVITTLWYGRRLASYGNL